VPIDASLPKTQEWVTSYTRTGVVIDFPLKRQRSALVRLVDSDGRALPTGTAVAVDDRPEPFFVGFDGEAFLTDLEGAHRLDVRGSGFACTIAINLAAADGPVAALGPYTCQGTQ
jgi:outer membrane usher protein